MSVVLAARGVVPPHAYAQADLTAALHDLLLGPDPDPALSGLLRRVHASAGVARRHLVQPVEAYAALRDLTDANDLFLRHGEELAAQAATAALETAGLTPQDVDVVAVATVTGVAVPTLDARLVPRLGLRDDVRRLPLVGLGCVAGAAGLARLHEVLTGLPDGAVGVLVTVELCSLTLQAHDTSRANLVASGLFGDGAAAVVLRGGAGDPGLDGARAPRPRVVASRSRLYPGTERAMGWDVGASGFRIVLDPGVPDLVRGHLGDDVKRFLADHDLDLADVGTWVCHPGGPKVLHAVQESLGLDHDALGLTWRSLAQVGNLSSASVLHVLAATLQERSPAPGSHGLLLAMGPGFCSELVLLRWDAA